MCIVLGRNPGLCTWWPRTELRPHLLLKMSSEAHVVSYPIGGVDVLSGCTGAQATSGPWQLLPQWRLRLVDLYPGEHRLRIKALRNALKTYVQVTLGHQIFTFYTVTFNLKCYLKNDTMACHGVSA